MGGATGSRLRPRYKEIQDMRLFEDTVSEEVTDKLSNLSFVFFFELKRRVEERQSDKLRSGRFM